MNECRVPAAAAEGLLNITSPAFTTTRTMTMINAANDRERKGGEGEMGVGRGEGEREGGGSNGVQKSLSPSQKIPIIRPQSHLHMLCAPTINLTKDSLRPTHY